MRRANSHHSIIMSRLDRGNGGALLNAGNQLIWFVRPWKGARESDAPPGRGRREGKWAEEGKRLALASPRSCSRRNTITGIPPPALSGERWNCHLEAGQRQRGGGNSLFRNMDRARKKSTAVTIIYYTNLWVNKITTNPTLCTCYFRLYIILYKSIRTRSGKKSWYQIIYIVK